MKRLRYQDQDCVLTLQEGLEEYLDHIGPDAKLTGDENSGLDEGYRQFLLGHDCQHIIFGLALSLEEESVLDTFALQGTIGIPWKKTFKYAFSGGELTKLYKKLHKAYGVSGILAFSFRARKKKVIAWKRVKLMTKKWPWYIPQEYFSRTIKDLRDEYNIKVLTEEELYFEDPTYM
jgi:hypothetical protein